LFARKRAPANQGMGGWPGTRPRPPTGPGPIRPWGGRFVPAKPGPRGAGRALARWAPRGPYGRWPPKVVAWPAIKENFSPSRGRAVSTAPPLGPERPHRTRATGARAALEIVLGPGPFMAGLLNRPPPLSWGRGRLTAGAALPVKYPPRSPALFCPRLFPRGWGTNAIGPRGRFVQAGAVAGWQREGPRLPLSVPPEGVPTQGPPKSFPRRQGPAGCPVVWPGNDFRKTKRWAGPPRVLRARGSNIPVFAHGFCRSPPVGIPRRARRCVFLGTGEAALGSARRGPLGTAGRPCLALIGGRGLNMGPASPSQSVPRGWVWEQALKRRPPLPPSPAPCWPVFRRAPRPDATMVVPRRPFSKRPRSPPGLGAPGPPAKPAALGGARNGRVFERRFAPGRLGPTALPAGMIAQDGPGIPGCGGRPATLGPAVLNRSGARRGLPNGNRQALRGPARPLFWRGGTEARRGWPPGAPCPPIGPSGNLGPARPGQCVPRGLARCGACFPREVPTVPSNQRRPPSKLLRNPPGPQGGAPGPLDPGRGENHDQRPDRARKWAWARVFQSPIPRPRVPNGPPLRSRWAHAPLNKPPTGHPGLGRGDKAPRA